MGKIENQKASTNPNQMRDIILVSSIAAGVQFGWALQLSLLTPYVQLLGIPHTWSAFIWLCGPVSGLLVQPIVGYFSDHCHSRFGRRRPFIAVGAFLVAFAVFLIGFAADVGHSFGDKVTDPTKPRAVALFVFGFWILDVANNTLQGPCRAFLADLSGGDTRMMSGANAFYSFFMAVGNVLGYAAGSYTNLYKIFPFSKTEACDVYCANLKSCFFISIALLSFVTILSLSIVREPDNPNASTSTSTDTDKGKDKVTDDQEPKVTVTSHLVPVFGELFSAFKEMPRAMWILFLVTGLNWIAWFPFLLFDTDWMGKEVYGGDVGNKLYDSGVRAGAIGLLINSVVLGFASLGVQPLARAIGGVKRVWGGVNFILAICLGMTVVITKYAEHSRTYGVGADGKPFLEMPSDNVKWSALAVFGVLGIPLAATFSVPFALASIYSSSTGAGQGLSLGTLNLAIVIPQMIISMASGPWDALFGGGNLPAFLLGAVSAAISGILALTLLPNPPSDSIASPSVMGSFH